jgi:hypothetical protein
MNAWGQALAPSLPSVVQYDCLTSEMQPTTVEPTVERQPGEGQPTVADYRRRVADGVMDEPGFVRAVFSGCRRGHTIPWQRVIVRPVDIKGRRHVQFTYYDAARSIDRNKAGAAVRAELAAILALPFRSLFVESVDRELQVTFSKRGEVAVRSIKKAAPVARPLAHDRQKQQPLPPGRPDDYLVAVGIMAADGRVKSEKYDKFRQINEFVKLLTQLTSTSDETPLPRHIVDFGCGNAYLTFATYHYFRDVLGHPVELCGVDVQGDLLAAHREKVAQLRWSGLTFATATISEYQASPAPDLVLSLHACDTATDDAIARAINWRSRYLLSVPCCHHHLQRQLRGKEDATALKPVYRHGVLAERLGDILTDTLRALILRLCGYRCDVVQFVSTEHTAKNVMIRAAWTGRLGEPAVVAEYARLKAFLGVTPYLERLLAPEFAALLAAPAAS